MSNNTVDIPVSEMIGSTLSELRKGTGMTQKEFSKIFGVSESSIAHYEQGITIPSADMLLKYADYFNVNIDYLFGRNCCNVKYSDLKNVMIGDMTLGETVNIISGLSIKQKRYLYDTIMLLKNSKQ